MITGWAERRAVLWRLGLLATPCFVSFTAVWTRRGFPAVLLGLGASVTVLFLQTPLPNWLTVAVLAAVLCASAGAYRPLDARRLGMVVRVAPLTLFALLIAGGFAGLVQLRLQSMRTATYGDPSRFVPHVSPDGTRMLMTTYSRGEDLLGRYEGFPTTWLLDTGTGEVLWRSAPNTVDVGYGRTFGLDGRVALTRLDHDHYASGFELLDTRDLTSQFLDELPASLGYWPLKRKRGRDSALFEWEGEDYLFPAGTQIYKGPRRGLVYTGIEGQGATRWDLLAGTRLELAGSTFANSYAREAPDESFVKIHRDFFRLPSGERFSQCPVGGHVVAWSSLHGLVAVVLASSTKGTRGEHHLLFEDGSWRVLDLGIGCDVVGAVPDGLLVRRKGEFWVCELDGTWLRCVYPLEGAAQ